jgi:siroheme decarboxylase
MDKKDKLILNYIQSNFPITKRPYLFIAEKLGLSEDDVIERIAKLKDTGIIRRIGGNFYPDKLGFVSTLCAAQVPYEKIEIFTKIVNEFKGVTHNYIRKHKYNIWFTFIAQSRENIEKNLKKISESTDVEILNLPATHVFKIKAKFEV